MESLFVINNYIIEINLNLIEFVLFLEAEFI